MEIAYPASAAVAAALEEDSEAEDVIMAEFWKRERREEGENFKILAPKNTKNVLKWNPRETSFSLTRFKNLLFFFFGVMSTFKICFFERNLHSWAVSCRAIIYMYIYREKRCVEYREDYQSHTFEHSAWYQRNKWGKKKNRTKQTKNRLPRYFRFHFSSISSTGYPESRTNSYSRNWSPRWACLYSCSVGVKWTIHPHRHEASRLAILAV